MSGPAPVAGGEAPGVRRARELADPGPPAVYRLESTEGGPPGPVSGITAAGPDSDYGLGTGTPVGRFLDRYRALAEALGFPAVVVPRQVHGARVLLVDLPPASVRDPAAAGSGGGVGRSAPATEGAGPAVLVAGQADGLVATRPGVLLAVTAADCVPVHVTVRGSDALALLHAGWRGVAAGVLEAGLARLREASDASPSDVRVHLGPAICGDCYEVGPEVPAALGLPEAPRVDLRRALAARARAAGVPEGAISASEWCTRCRLDRFHSHRGSGAEAGRMAAFLGRRAPPA